MTQSSAVVQTFTKSKGRSKLTRSKRGSDEPSPVRSPILNEHGDQGLVLPGNLGYGTDINQGRTDDLDEKALGFVTRLVKKRSGGVLGYDVGCGYGQQTIAFALAGADVHCIDLTDTRSLIEERFAASTLGRTKARYRGSIHFHNEDVRSLDFADISKNAYFFYSQRTLHYLPYADMFNLFQRLRPTLLPSAQLFIGVSGINSPLRQGYVHADLAIENRFAPLNLNIPDVRKHDIRQPVCLYSKAELADLFSAVGYRVLEVQESSFGNVKGIFAV